MGQKQNLRSASPTDTLNTNNKRTTESYSRGLTWGKWPDFEIKKQKAVIRYDIVEM